jgi:hypothetical protein
MNRSGIILPKLDQETNFFLTLPVELTEVAQ